MNRLTRDELNRKISERLEPTPEYGTLEYFGGAWQDSKGGCWRAYLSKLGPETKIRRADPIDWHAPGNAMKLLKDMAATRDFKLESCEEGICVFEPHSAQGVLFESGESVEQCVCETWWQWRNR